MELKPVRTDDQSFGRPPSYEGPAQDTAVEVSQTHRVLRNTYMLLGASLVPTAIGAALGANIDLSFMRSSPIISFFAVLAIFYGWIYSIEKNKNSAIGVGLLPGFTLFM